MSFTEGKWEVRDAGKGTITFIESGDFCVCQLAYCDLDEQEGHELQLANARLIAAAPELLEACKKAFIQLLIYETNHNEICKLGEKCPVLVALKGCEAAIAAGGGK